MRERLEGGSGRVQYGDKYIQRFKALGSEQLSPEGLAWRDRALKGLQDAMEKRIHDGAAKFAELERDPEKFKDFAYDTHVDAYVKAGLFALPAQDLKTILLTPDYQDLLNPEGMKQIINAGMEARPHDMPAIAAATTSEAVRRNIQPTVEQIELEMKARMAQGWLNSGY
ncbi:hypothetical protein [Vitiosangium sp. GDMCC 1.1324]|uniref:hypothetical protein n=1 Tax=Vitiosangium sp. (strain GDMCC 1.1324) TaxID=2138576 RepID=UPI000D37D514|nr:hypothetical protein [Vitiosangium sp. GDMCC 1.1324]PTL83795.1 hypothetical protein DAT35_10005 [Vitiosangium sp. GDMCC 1.1324]